MAFSGFPPETFDFLSGLAQNNSKTWFDAHRPGYEAHWLAPAAAFVEAVAPGLRAIAPDVACEPRVNGSIFRINRDVRFSKDKRPYKTTLDLWFWQGARRSWEAPGFYLRLQPGSLIAGAGLHSFSPAQLAAFRAAVLDPVSGAALEAVIAGLGLLSLDAPTRKTVPRGFDPAHPRAGLLRHEGLHAMHDGPLPASVYSAALVDEVLAIFARAAPVSRWLQAWVVGRDSA